jgi:hypothetical protein
VLLPLLALLLLVFQVVLRCGLMGPWDAGAPLVAQLTDEVPETRAAALKVIKGCGCNGSLLHRTQPCPVTCWLLNAQLL